MVDNSGAKRHLQNTETTLNDLTKPELINNILGARSLNLYSTLSSKNLFIDADILVDLKEVQQSLNDVTSQAHNQQSYVDGQIAALPAGGSSSAARASLTQKKIDLNLVETNPRITTRRTEYNNLVKYAEYFNLSGTLGNATINTSTGVGSIIPLDSAFMDTGTPGTPTSPNQYELCDESGVAISSTGGNYKLNIGGQEYTIGGINFTGGNLDCHAVTISPNLKDSPQEITLSINAIFNAATVGVDNVNVVHNKKFKLTLNDGTTPLNTGTARQTEFDRYNNSLPTGHKIENIVETNFTGNIHAIERKVLAKILEKNGGTQYSSLNEGQKETFYQRMRTINNGTPPLPYFDNIFRSENINNAANRFNEYRAWFVNDSRDWNKGANIKTASQYVTFIHNNVAEKVSDFISSRLEHYLGDIAQETLLKSELTSFINEIENNKLDNDTNIYTDVNNYASSNEHQMDRKRNFNIRNFWGWVHDIGRSSDTNYMRFFSGSSASLKGEIVDIHTNISPDSTDKKEPLKYDMDIKISGKNNIEVEIKIEGENSPIRIKSGDPASLVRKIMRDSRIQYGKARAHMGFNIYKSMIKMAKENDMSLQYRDSGNDHTRFIDINDGKIVVRDVDTLASLAPATSTIIFDQAKFINTNQFNNYGENGSLRTGIDELGKHFTLAMNQLHNQYRHGVERKFGTLFNSNSRMNLPTSFWKSPIKKLLNLRDHMNFDFNTSVKSKGKNINIDFKKNKFTINMEGIEKPIVSKDLGKILNKRLKGNRIFDGMERDIVEGVYSSLISKLRENGRIANTDFGVMDNITGNMYVLDVDGRFGVITKENLNMIGSPLRSGEYGRLNHSRLSRNTVDRFEHSSFEERELMKNPFLMQRFVKAMNKRLGWW